MRPMTRHDLDWIDIAPVKVTRSRRLPVPPARVWAAIADHASWPEWFTSLASVTPGPVADTADGTRQVALGPIVVDEEFLAFEPERRFAFTVVASNRRFFDAMVEDVRLTPDGTDATTITYTQALDLPGARVLRPVLVRALGRTLDGALAALESHLRD